MELTGKRVFVTGAASGIGRALAVAVAADGGHLYLTDRNGAALQAVADEVVRVGGTLGRAVPVDVSDRAAVHNLAAAIDEPMDVVMNVAGIATWGTVDRLSHEQWQRVIDVNLMGPIHVIEEFLPPMIRAGRGGYLVNVSSAAGLFGLPWHAPYSASKFGLRGISEVLRFDLREHRIGVSLVVPGGVDTPLANTVEIAGVDKTTPGFERLTARFRRRAVTPERAAAAILRGVRRDRYLVYTSRDIQLLHLMQRLCPPVYAFVMRVMNRELRRALRSAVVA